MVPVLLCILGDEISTSRFRTSKGFDVVFFLAGIGDPQIVDKLKILKRFELRAVRTLIEVENSGK